MTPFLRWAGSKRQLLPVLSALVDSASRRYIEPFAGSACLFFRLGPKRAVLGDINRELILTYEQIKNDVSEVADELHQLRKCKAVYLKLRSANPSSLSPAARGARFIFLNRCCFNGLYRTNRSGEFNVPYGGERSGELPTRDILQECSLALQAAQLVCGDFEAVLKNVKAGDFVYLDPPFSVKARRVFNEYDASVFTGEQLCRLRGWMQTFANRRISFLVSYAVSDEATFLSNGFKSKEVTVRRNIAGFSKNRSQSKELLIWN